MISLIEALTIFILIGIICILYKKYENKLLKENYILDNNNLLRKYLLNQSSLTDIKKPILWIYIPYEYNARNWINFGSRSSCELNQPYLYLTLKSIIMNCDTDFNIVIIDDTTFHKLIPNWNINMDIISNPIKNYIKHLGILKLLYIYGGFCVPLSFLCFKSLLPLYNQGIELNKMFVCENIANNIKNTHMDFYPDINMLGSVKENIILSEFIEFVKIKISNDYTDQTNFLGDLDAWLKKYNHKGLVNIIDSSLIGVKDTNNNPILIDNLMSEEFIQLDDNAYGILIPSNEILNRRKYEYYARLSIKQVLESNSILSQYILLAMNNETMIGEMDIKKPNYWTGWWKTDLDPPLYGMRPLMVAPKDRVQKLSYPGEK